MEHQMALQLAQELQHEAEAIFYGLVIFCFLLSCFVLGLSKEEGPNTFELLGVWAFLVGLASASWFFVWALVGLMWALFAPEGASPWSVLWLTPRWIFYYSALLLVYFLPPIRRVFNHLYNFWIRPLG
ncbi:hypothetical protein J7L13_03765 [bacterium]|nr:hypothetical protein [bacterium]